MDTRNSTEKPRATVNTLTGKQRPFLEHYLIHFNATKAAAAAGYANPDKAGSRVLKVPKVAAALDHALNELVMKRNEALRILSSQARAEYSQFFIVATDEERPALRIDLAAMLAAGKGHLIKSVREGRYGQELEFYDAQTAVVWIGKHHQLFTDIIKTDRDAELDAALDKMNQETAIKL